MEHAIFFLEFTKTPVKKITMKTQKLWKNTKAKKCKNKESSFPSIVKLFDDKNEVHDMFKILGALKEKNYLI
jgi:hypothetical protein